MVAGGGGGGGGATVRARTDGGLGGSGGDPGQNGTRGLSPSGSIFGGFGRGASLDHNNGNHGGHGENAATAGGGGGGGGGGFYGGFGGKAGGKQPRQSVGSGGGGGGGLSYLDDELHEQVGFGLAPLGGGSITIYPSAPLPRYTCADTHDPRVIDIAPDVVSYAFVAMGGGGEHGSNVGPEGSGAFLTGVLDVHDLTQLHYWVGCSGYDHDGRRLRPPGLEGRRTARRQ